MRALKRGLLVLAAVLGAGVLAGCTPGSDNPTIQPPPTVSSTAPTQTVTASPSPTASRPPSPTPTNGAAGGATTIQSAEAYEQSRSDQVGGPLEFIGADSTWRAAATLLVLHSTPTNTADYGGDYYSFFVNGNAVGEFSFTHAVGERASDASSFTITYNVFKPGDPHCCPTGGNAAVTFHWDGSKLVHDPTPGATQN
jgi:hypothetical protein